MDMTTHEPVYPPRLFEEGKAPFQNHSMNHNCYLSMFGIVRESLGEEVWDSLKESSVGVILKLCEKKYIFSSKIVHEFLTNQLNTSKPHEMWSVIFGQPLRLSLNEFGELTGLKCHPYPDEDSMTVNHKGFWKDLGVSPIQGPSWVELLEVLSSCASWTFTKKKMVGLLCVLSVGIFGIHRTSRIPLEAAKRVMDLDAFETYPWGRVACESLIAGVKVITYDKKSYHVKGLVPVLQIWAYESVEVLGESLGKKRDDDDVIPLLRWMGSRDRFKLTEIFEQEIKTHSKVRVRNLCIKPQAEIFPEWADDVDDSRHQTLVDDLVKNRFIQSYYVSVPKNNEKKRKPVSAVHSSQKDKKGKKEINMTSPRRAGEGSSKDGDEQISSKEGFKIDDISTSGMSKMLLGFGEKLELIQENVVNSLTGMAASLECQFNAKQNSALEQMEARIAKLEYMVEAIYNRGQPSDALGAVGIKVPDAKKDESSQKKEKKSKKRNKTPSPTPSWLVQKVETSQEEFPIACAIKKPTTTKEKSNSNIEVTSKIRLSTIKKEKISPIRGIKRNLRSKKELQVDAKDDEIEDVTKELKGKEKGVCVSESYTWSNPVQEKIHKSLNKGLAKMVESLQEPNLGGQGKRGKQRSKVLGNQFVGNLTMKRLIPKNVIEPTSLVDDHKLKKLLDFIKENESTPIGKNRGMKFLRLLKPKESWLKNEQSFGWLHDGHMEDIMKLFTLRSMSDNSPFCSRRIAFLDPIFVNSMVSDFPQFDMGPKKFMFPDGNARAVNGNFHDDVPTNLKWFVDIDRLYMTHHIKPGHWAALDVNLKEDRIDVYDSIESTSTNNEVLVSCRPFAKMIPYLLSLHVPKELRKKKTAMFLIKRVKGIPQNIQTGDCGVYTVKYIERLALGEDFDGLCDTNMPAFHLQLACDVFNEIHLAESSKCFKIPQLKDEDLDNLDESYTSPK